MADKNLTIRIETVGSDEAATKIEQTARVVENLKKSEALEERIALLKERTEAIKEEAEQAATAAKQEEQIALVKAQTYQRLGESLERVASGMKQMADGIRQDAPEMAAHLDTAATAAGSLGSAANGAAQGFAVGGPFGAAIGAVVGSLLPSLKSALDDMTQSLAGAEASQRRLTESTAKLADMEANADYFEWARKAKDDMDAAAAAAGNLARETARAKEINQAQTAADKAERDAADEAAIRGGQDPVEVKRRRVVDDAAAERAALEKEIREAAEKRSSAYDFATTARQAAIYSSKAQGPDGTDAKADQAKAAEAERAYQEAADRESILTEKADARRREIAAKEAQEMGRLDDQAAARAKAESERRSREEDSQRREAEQAEAEAKREQQRAAREAAQARLEAARGGLDRSATAAAGRFNDEASGRVPNRATGQALASIADQLADGTNAEELRRIEAQFARATQGLGGATVATLKSMLGEMEKQAKAIEILQNQVKSGRMGR